MKDNSQQGATSEYVTSSRAAQLSGYSQDYVGQLCRGTSIECRRVSGEWHVALVSLLAYKERFSPEKDISLEEVNLESVSKTDSGHKETFTDTDGVFISSSDAAKRTGYSQDYVGQLARSGAVTAKKIGRKWFVEQEALEQHKSHNDNLLAAVQAGSVGVKPVAQNADIDHKTKPLSVRKDVSIPIVTYKHDDGSLVPSMARGEVSGSEERHEAEVHSMPLVTGKTQVERKDLRSRPVYSRKQKVEPVLGNGISSKKAVISTEEIAGVTSPVFSRMILSLIVSVSLFSIFTSLSAPETFHKYVVKVLSSVNISLSTDYLESTNLGKKTLHITSAIIKYKK